MKLAETLTAIAVISATPDAHALCIYEGVDNAKTTIAEEFKASKWVVRAKVMGSSDHFSDQEDSWTLYQIRVLRSYKGSPPQHLRFFTFRDSGGFYMDRDWVPLPAGHDIGGEYLLFLDPWPRRKDLPPEAKGTVFVDYDCGVSGQWAKFSTADRALLASLARRR
jgi:hypothetical protein